MTYKMFIDDERFPVNDDCVIVRSSAEAMGIVKDRGLPVEIMFDHDLGGDDTSMVFLKQLVDYMLDNNLKFPENFTYSVHSQNPVGANNIHQFICQMSKHFI